MRRLSLVLLMTLFASGCGEVMSTAEPCPDGQAANPTNPYLCETGDETPEHADVMSDMSGATDDLAQNRADSNAQAADDSNQSIQAKRGGDGSEGLAAEAVQKSDSSLPLPNGRGRNASGTGGADVGVVRPGGSGGSSLSGVGATTAAAGGVAAGTDESAKSEQSEEELAKARMLASGVEFESSGAAGGARSARGNSDYGFGDAGPQGNNGADGVRFTGMGGEFGGAVSMDSYLERVGAVSLFEVVNRRTEKFTRQIEVNRAIGEFKKLSN